MVKLQFFWEFDISTGLPIDLGMYAPELFDRFILDEPDENGWSSLTEQPNIKVSTDQLGIINKISVLRPLEVPFMNFSTDPYDLKQRELILDRMDESFTRMKDIKTMEEARNSGQTFVTVIFRDTLATMIFICSPDKQ